MTRRHLARRGLNRLLRPLHLRIVTDDLLHEGDRRLERLAASFHDVYRAEHFPDLPERPTRAARLARLDGTQLPEAMHLLHGLHASLASGPGDVVEIGVCQGYTSALLASELPDGRDLWLYDSFEGLSTPTEEDELLDDTLGLGSMAAYAGRMAVGEESVRAQLAAVGFPPERTHVVRGVLHTGAPPRELPDVVAFAYLDVDLYEPTLVALEALHPRTRPGSVLVVDDYGFLSTGPERAVERFLAAHPDHDRWVAEPPTGHFCVLTRR